MLPNYFLFLLLLYCGDIERNPGPLKSMEIFFCNWNLNSVSAHDFSNASLLKAMATYKQYDIICLSETFPDSSIERTDNRLNIQ